MFFSWNPFRSSMILTFVSLFDQSEEFKDIKKVKPTNLKLYHARVMLRSHHISYRLSRLMFKVTILGCFVFHNIQYIVI